VAIRLFPVGFMSTGSAIVVATNTARARLHRRYRRLTDQ
jgi:hypothetical protein